MVSRGTSPTCNECMANVVRDCFQSLWCPREMRDGTLSPLPIELECTARSIRRRSKKLPNSERIHVFPRAVIVHHTIAGGGRRAARSIVNICKSSSVGASILLVPVIDLHNPLGEGEAHCRLIIFDVQRSAMFMYDANGMYAWNAYLPVALTFWAELVENASVHGINVERPTWGVYKSVQRLPLCSFYTSYVMHVIASSYPGETVRDILEALHEDDRETCARGVDDSSTSATYAAAASAGGAAGSFVDDLALRFAPRALKHGEAVMAFEALGEHDAVYMSARFVRYDRVSSRSCTKKKTKTTISYAVVTDEEGEERRFYACHVVPKSVGRELISI